MSPTYSPLVEIDSPASLTGYDSLTLKAQTNSVTAEAHSDATSSALGANTSSTANNGLNAQAQVTAEAGATLETSQLTVSAASTGALVITNPEWHGAAIDTGSTSSQGSQTQKGTVDFNAAVTIFEQAPVLRIASDGDVLENAGISYSENPANNELILDSITSSTTGKVSLTAAGANDQVVKGTRPSRLIPASRPSRS